MNLNKLCFVFFVFVLNTIIFSQTILKHNELMFSNNGGFRDVMHEESIYPLIPDDVNYLDSILWLTATASLTASQGYGTMNLVVRPPEIGSDRVLKKHLWAGPWNGGSKNDSKLYARISHFEGSASFDNTINKNLKKFATFGNDLTLKSIDIDGNEADVNDKYSPFISEFRIGTSLYQNLMYINVEEGTLSGGKTGLSIETYEAIDITLERVNPVKLGLQMEGGDIFAGNLYIDAANKKVFFSNGKNLSASKMRSDMEEIFGDNYGSDYSTALIVSGNVVAEQLFGKVVTMDSFTLKSHIGKICHSKSDVKTYYIHSSQLLEKKCSDRSGGGTYGLAGKSLNIFNDLVNTSEIQSFSLKESMSTEKGLLGSNYSSTSSPPALEHSGAKKTGSPDYSQLIPGYFPLNWLFNYNTFRINLLSSVFFKSTTVNGGYTLPENANKVIVNVQATVGAFDSSGDGFNHTLCTKIRWHRHSVSLATGPGIIYPESNELTDILGTSSAMCKDYSTYDSEFTFSHTFAISTDDFPQSDAPIQFDLNIYTVYEDGYNEVNEVEFPEYIEVSNTSLIIQSFPADTTNEFSNARPTDNFQLELKKYSDFGRHDHL